MEWEAGGLRPRGTRGGGKGPYFKAELTDSRCEKKEGTEGVGAGHRKDLCCSTDPGSNLSPTTYYTFGSVPLPLILTEGSLDL